ncbi:uncharacterized protein LOC115211140 [Argonauta hians]
MEKVLFIVGALLAGVQATAPPPPLALFNLRTVRSSYDYNSGGPDSFHYLYVTQDGYIHEMKPCKPSIAITGTSTVSKEALRKAGFVVSHMIKYAPNEVFIGLTKSRGVGLFNPAEGPTIFPENSRLADYPECYNKCTGKCNITCSFDGRKWQDISGLTDTRAAVLAANVLCSENDPYSGTESILNHEFGHLVNAYMPKEWRDKIEAAYKNAAKNKLWTLGTYGMANAQEYFAEATEAFFFDSIRTDVSAGLNMCGSNTVCPDVQSTRKYLEENDPLLYQVLVYAYSNGRPNLVGPLKICV